jgi:hypothetical protein
MKSTKQNNTKYIPQSSSAIEKYERNIAKCMSLPSYTIEKYNE